jgi:hypothetical protein
MVSREYCESRFLVSVTVSGQPRGSEARSLTSSPRAAEGPSSLVRQNLGGGVISSYFWRGQGW